MRARIGEGRSMGGGQDGRGFVEVVGSGSKSRSSPGSYRGRKKVCRMGKVTILCCYDLYWVAYGRYMADPQQREAIDGTDAYWILAMDSVCSRRHQVGSDMYKGQEVRTMRRVA